MKHTLAGLALLALSGCATNHRLVLHGQSHGERGVEQLGLDNPVMDSPYVQWSAIEDFAALGTMRIDIRGPILGGLEHAEPQVHRSVAEVAEVWFRLMRCLRTTGELTGKLTGTIDLDGVIHAENVAQLDSWYCDALGEMGGFRVGRKSAFPTRFDLTIEQGQESVSIHTKLDQYHHQRSIPLPDAVDSSDSFNFAQDRQAEIRRAIERRYRALAACARGRDHVLVWLILRVSAEGEFETAEPSSWAHPAEPDPKIAECLTNELLKIVVLPTTETSISVGYSFVLDVQGDPALADREFGSIQIRGADCDQTAMLLEAALSASAGVVDKNTAAIFDLAITQFRAHSPRKAQRCVKQHRSLFFGVSAWPGRDWTEAEYTALRGVGAAEARARLNALAEVLPKHSIERTDLERLARTITVSEQSSLDALVKRATTVRQ